MTGTDKDERCHCPSEGSVCPHCGRQGNADHKARCHRAAIGVGPSQLAEKRAFFYFREWRGGKRRLRRLARQRLKRRDD